MTRRPMPALYVVEDRAGDVVADEDAAGGRWPPVARCDLLEVSAVGVAEGA
jgi:hypothetical protein